jgi:hypothetical protein
MHLRHLPSRGFEKPRISVTGLYGVGNTAAHKVMIGFNRGDFVSGDAPAAVRRDSDRPGVFSESSLKRV